MKYGRLGITPLGVNFDVAPDTGLRSDVGIKMMAWIPQIYNSSLIMQSIFEAIGTEWEDAENWISTADESENYEVKKMKISYEVEDL